MALVGVELNGTKTLDGMSFKDMNMPITGWYLICEFEVWILSARWMKTIENTNEPTIQQGNKS